MDHFKGVSKEKRTKFLEEQHKLIDKGVFSNPKQGGSGNGNLQRGKMSKDDCKYIVREVVTAIGESASNAVNNKMEILQQETAGTEEQCASEPNKEDI